MRLAGAAGRAGVLSGRRSGLGLIFPSVVVGSEEGRGRLTLEFVGIDRLQDFDLFELFFGGHGLRTLVVGGSWGGIRG